MILKNISRKTTVQLTYIINSVLKLNHFPDQYKTAIVVPIPKAGKSLNKKDNFRPISLLNSISKVIEKIMYRRFNTFLDEHNITQDSQFGFKNHHSTTQENFERILLNFNQDKNTVFTLLDIEIVIYIRVRDVNFPARQLVSGTMAQPSA
jgi:TPP-dependent 2-oxoacid decarboxylase